MTKSIAFKYEITKEQGINIILLIIISILCGIILVLMGAFGLWMGLHPAIYYTITLIISLLLPKFVFKSNWNEFLIYNVLGISTGFLSHVIFSLFLGYNNLNYSSSSKNNT